ncbi:MAG TPA: abortive infection system antitoxin AbiGi family protein [Methylomirabilota bacterium]|nr:abortive infection system antitoxin AbiGi family protein [Methylomirabilota bacterium]
MTRRFTEFRRQVPAQYLQAVCLTDTPPEALPTLIGDILGRRDRLDNYGLVFSKRFILERGGSPVVYLATQAGNALADALFSLLCTRLERRTALRRDVAPLLPLIETFGPGYFNPNRLVDFHWEREWRVSRNLVFRRRDVLLGLCDERDISPMERQFRPLRFIDPCSNPANWGQKIERARAVGWEQYLEPFP